MRKLWILVAAYMIMIQVRAQENVVEALVEDQVKEDDDHEQEEDLQVLQYLIKHPLDINTAGPEELSVFPFISVLQAEKLVLYRKMLGPLQQILELQAVPGWQAEMIRKLKPYITVGVQESQLNLILSEAGKGRQQLLTRIAMRSFAGKEYLGSSPAVLFRYQYRSKYLQGSLNTEKDSGERFIQNGKGISFISFHIAIQGKGFIRQMVIGDFLVNLGQGLIHWQGRSAGKTGMPIMIMRQLPMVQPYRSNDENRFHRGLGLIMKKGRMEGGLFISADRIDANRKPDSVTGRIIISSVLTSGYHRTLAELDDKDALGVKSIGAALRYQSGEFRSGINVIHHLFSYPLAPEYEPYRVFAFRGSHMANYSLDYQHTLRNTHFFGELAVSENRQLAFLQGVMFSADPRLDISFLLRKISRAYHAFQGHAFTESAEPANEEGFYTGASFRISPMVTLDAYLDHYRFPWLKYRLDMPGWGREYLLQASWRPGKKTTMYWRYRDEQKIGNLSEIQKDLPSAVQNLSTSNQFPPVLDYPGSPGLSRKINWRFHLDHHFSLRVEWRIRVEYTSLLQLNRRESGFLFFSDIFWAPGNSRFSFNARIMRYETTSYASRIYAFENDVMYYNIVPAFFGKGSLAYVNVHFSPGKNLQVFIKSAIQYNDNTMPASKMFRAQFIYSWN